MARELSHFEQAVGCNRAEAQLPQHRQASDGVGHSCLTSILFITWAIAAGTAQGQSLGWGLRATAGPSSRYSPAMAFDETRHQTVLFGGYVGSASTQNGETWVWNGATWTSLGVSGPSARSSTMAFDASRNEIVLFGGHHTTGSAESDTWVWNGTNWSTRTPSPHPSDRYYHAMAFDAVAHEVVLFGGQSIAGAMSGETWTWNGSGGGSWTQHGVTGPSARRSAGMAFDAARGVVILFGGYNDTTNTTFGDTWSWNGSVWTQLAVTGPSARCGPMLAYDSARQVIVLFGGTTDPQNNAHMNGETWEWDGAAWTQRTIGGPSPRISSGYTFDSDRGTVVLFGGANGTTSVQDTWELCGVSVLSDPSSHVGCPHGTATLTVSAGGAGSLTYAWRLDGALIDPLANPSAGTASLFLSNLQFTDAGLYDCEVSNGCAAALSEAAELQVCVANVNCDEVVDLADFFQFLSDFDQSLPGADINGDISVDLTDFFGFLNAFDQGC